MKIVDQSVELVCITENASQVIEKAGRVCYKSEGSITEHSKDYFIQSLLNRGHHSVLEHASASFRITCDRGISHEFVRHRLASFSQESTRYCNYSKDRFNGQISVIKPVGLTGDQENLWINSCRGSEEAYFNLVNCGSSPQVARSVLPSCLKTEFVVTANFREWIHIIKLRGSREAHPQIRSLAFDIYKILKKECPEVFEKIESPPLYCI